MNIKFITYKHILKDFFMSLKCILWVNGNKQGMLLLYSRNYYSITKNRKLLKF